MSLKLIFRTENGKVGIISNSLRLILSAPRVLPRGTISLELRMMVSSTSDILLRMRMTHGLEQLNRLGATAGPAFNICSSTRTVPCMVSCLESCTKDRLQQKMRGTERSVSAPEGGKFSNSCSMIPMGFCMG